MRGFVIHFDAAHNAVDRARHVIIDEQAFEAETDNLTPLAFRRSARRERARRGLEVG